MSAGYDKMKNLISSLIKFGSVGILTMIFGLICYFFAFEVWDFPLYATYLVVFKIGVIFAFIVNSKLTFKAPITFPNYWKYLSSNLFGFVIGLLILFILSKFLPDDAKFLKMLIMIPPRTVIIFAILKLIVYRKNTS